MALFMFIPLWNLKYTIYHATTASPYVLLYTLGHLSNCRPFNEQDKHLG